MAKKQVIDKLAGLERIQADTEAAESVVEMEMNQARLKADEQKLRERLIAQSHEIAGQIKTADMFSKFGDVSRLIWLKQVKESKVYKAIGTWDSYCNYLGLDRRTVDEDLQNLSAFGKDFLETVANLSVGYRDLRKLRQIAHNGDIVIDAECVTVGEETIPLSSDHAEDLQAAIESILETKNTAIEDQAATIKAKDRVLADKEKLINQKEKKLAQLEGTAKAKGYTAGEEALIQKMDNARTIIDGFLMQFDPEIHPLPEDCTVRMRAKLMHTLDYFKRVIIATFDTASDLYGEPEMDDDWVPPHLRRPEDGGQKTEDREKNCTTCDFHKGMSNKAKGVKVPGEYGKCTRPEGPCKTGEPADAEV